MYSFINFLLSSSRHRLPRRVFFRFETLESSPKHVSDILKQVREVKCIELDLKMPSRNKKDGLKTDKRQLFNPILPALSCAVGSRLRGRTLLVSNKSKKKVLLRYLKQ
jgi:hypothetical protein